MRLVEAADHVDGLAREHLGHEPVAGVRHPHPGPKKSDAATLTVGVGEASRARSSSARMPSLPRVASRGSSSVIGPSTAP